VRSRRSARPEPGDDATALLPQRSDVGFVFQHYAPFKHLSIWDNVAFGLKVRKTAKPEMREHHQRQLRAFLRPCVAAVCAESVTLANCVSDVEHP